MDKDGRYKWMNYAVKNTFEGWKESYWTMINGVIATFLGAETWLDEFRYMPKIIFLERMMKLKQNLAFLFCRMIQ